MVTRILVAGDPGGQLPHNEILFKAAEANGCSAIYPLGDTGYSEDDIGSDTSRQLSEMATGSGIDIAFIDGNHEDHGALWRRCKNALLSPEGFSQVRPGLFYIPRGHDWEVEGVRLLGLGGAYSVDKNRRLDIEKETGRPGSMWSEHEEITDADVVRAKAAIAARGPVDIMLTHDKPRGSTSGGDFNWGLQSLTNQDKVSEVMRAAEPTLLLHGHLHVPYRDHVRISALDYCEVICLESDESGSRTLEEYDPRNSWLVLELHNGKYKIAVMPPALAEV